MKVLELFAGTRSISKAFEEKGHETYSIEWDKEFHGISLYSDILHVTAQEIIKNFGYPDVIWASPDCSTYSIAAISHHRVQSEDGSLAPVSEYAKQCDKVPKYHRPGRTGIYELPMRGRRKVARGQKARGNQYGVCKTR